MADDDSYLDDVSDSGFNPGPEDAAAAVVTNPIGEDDLLQAMAAAEDLEPSADDAYEAAKAEATKAEKTFANLTAVQHIRELWEAKGIHQNDPMFAFIELMGLWDIRQRAGYLQLAQVVEKSDQFHMSVLNEMREMVEPIAGFQLDAEQIRVLTAASCEAMRSLDGSNSELLRELPVLYGTTRQAVTVIGEMGRYQVLLNVAVPLVSVLVGMLAMFGVLAFLGFIKVG